MERARQADADLPPAPNLPICLAGLADETVRLAGELADGVLFLRPNLTLEEIDFSLGAFRP